MPQPCAPYGEEHGIEEFTLPKLPLRGSLTGEALALIALQLTGADAYHRGPYEGGAAFVLLRLPDGAPRQVPGDVMRAALTLARAPMALPVLITRQAIEAYFRWIGLRTENRGRDLVGRDASDHHVVVTFDRLGRVAKVTSTLGS